MNAFSDAPALRQMRIMTPMARNVGQPRNPTNATCRELVMNCTAISKRDEDGGDRPDPPAIGDGAGVDVVVLPLHRDQHPGQGVDEHHHAAGRWPAGRSRCAPTWRRSRSPSRSRRRRRRARGCPGCGAGPAACARRGDGGRRAPRTTARGGGTSGRRPSSCSSCARCPGPILGEAVGAVGPRGRSCGRPRLRLRRPFPAPARPRFPALGSRARARSSAGLSGGHRR